MTIVFVILDGLADNVKAHSGATPLCIARKPNLNRIASNSLFGVWKSVDKRFFERGNYSIKSMSDVTLSLLGYSLRDCPGRGYLEALGIGLKPRKDEIYVRGNFATVDENLNIIDRRAGREELGLDELARALEMRVEIRELKKGSGAEKIKIKCYHTSGHRAVVVLRGRGLSTRISDSDMGLDKPARIIPLSKRAEKTALVLNVFSEVSHEILERHPVNRKRKYKANYILLRGASKMKKVKSFREKYRLRACCVTGVTVIKGISRYLGIDVIDVKGANGHVNTNLRNKVEAVLRAIKRYDFVLLHINGADEAAHDRNPTLKKKFIERVDREVFGRLIDKNVSMVVTCDHVTNSKTGNHELGEVPFLIYSPRKTYRGVENFCEVACRRGIATRNLFKLMLRELAR